jgi:hypothetical protein
MLMKTLILLISILFVGFSSYAQDTTPKVDGRAREQRARIRQGRASGELTHKETARLNSQERRIHRTARRAKADGRVTKGERHRLNHEQNRASRNIRRQKHDAQTKNVQ